MSMASVTVAPSGDVNGVALSAPSLASATEAVCGPDGGLETLALDRRNAGPLFTSACALPGRKSHEASFQTSGVNLVSEGAGDDSFVPDPRTSAVDSGGGGIRSPDA